MHRVYLIEKITPSSERQLFGSITIIVEKNDANSAIVRKLE